MDYLEAAMGEHIFKKLMSLNEMFMFFDNVKYFWGSWVVFRKETYFFQIVLFLSSFSCIVSGDQLYFFKVFTHLVRGMIPDD